VFGPAAPARNAAVNSIENAKIKMMAINVVMNFGIPYAQARLPIGANYKSLPPAGTLHFF
tara:strand:- start:372 stop:551 length:180 start_codon:yes stop_codon:yes gene_type:complete